MSLELSKIPAKHRGMALEWERVKDSGEYWVLVREGRFWRDVDQPVWYEDQDCKIVHIHPIPNLEGVPQ
jgi:hypothetical protein